MVEIKEKDLTEAMIGGTFFLKKNGSPEFVQGALIRYYSSWYLGSNDIELHGYNTGAAKSANVEYSWMLFLDGDKLFTNEQNIHEVW